MPYNSYVYAVEVKTSAWTPLATLTGPATLKGVAVAKSDQRDHKIKIEHNGNVIANDIIAGSQISTNQYQNSGITFDIPFDGQLVVSAKDQPPVPVRGQKVLHRYWITCTTGHQPVRVASDDTDG